MKTHPQDSTQDGTVVVPCDKDSEDQRVEIGVVEDNKTLVTQSLTVMEDYLARCHWTSPSGRRG